MRKVLALAAALAMLLLLDGCEPPRGTIYLHNNSSETVTLRNVVNRRDKPEEPPLYLYAVSAKPESTEPVAMDPPGGCLLNWEIIDATGMQLRTVDKICDGQTVTYP